MLIRFLIVGLIYLTIIVVWKAFWSLYSDFYFWRETKKSDLPYWSIFDGYNRLNILVTPNVIEEFNSKLYIETICFNFPEMTEDSYSVSFYIDCHSIPSIPINNSRDVCRYFYSSFLFVIYGYRVKPPYRIVGKSIPNIKFSDKYGLFLHNASHEDDRSRYFEKDFYSVHTYKKESYLKRNDILEINSKYLCRYEDTAWILFKPLFSIFVLNEFIIQVYTFNIGF